MEAKRTNIMDPNIQTNVDAAMIHQGNISVAKEGKKVGGMTSVVDPNVSVPFVPSVGPTESGLNSVSLPSSTVAVNPSETIKPTTLAEANAEQHTFGTAYPPLLPGLPISADAEDKKAGGKWTPEVCSLFF